MFDKTGTLTAGKPSVVDVETTSDTQQHSEVELLLAAAAVERHASHPVASAITAAASSTGESCNIEPL